MALPSLGSDPFLGPSTYPLKIKQLQYTARNRFQSRIAQILLKNQQITCASPTVFCRIGSLESVRVDGFSETAVFCRIGSLESTRPPVPCPRWVFCRIGSLETRARRRLCIATCFLPHRQLRNLLTDSARSFYCFLPHRQLRNSPCRRPSRRGMFSAA